MWWGGWDVLWWGNKDRVRVPSIKKEKQKKNPDRTRSSKGETGVPLHRCTGLSRVGRKGKPSSQREKKDLRGGGPEGKKNETRAP